MLCFADNTNQIHFDVSNKKPKILIKFWGEILILQGEIKRQRDFEYLNTFSSSLHVF